MWNFLISIGVIMLSLLSQVYRRNSKRADLDETISLLENTSVLIENYTKPAPVTTTIDTRLQSNQQVLDWFNAWNDSKIDQKAFITSQTFEDLTSLIVATKNYVSLRLQQNPMAHIYLHRLNSDIAENVFSSQRGICNGCNNNPSMLEYSKNLNSIIISQSALSRKRNANSSDTIGGAYPYNILAKKTFREKHST